MEIYIGSSAAAQCRSGCREGRSYVFTTDPELNQWESSVMKAT